jgi:hypothetical protein
MRSRGDRPPLDLKSRSVFPFKQEEVMSETHLRIRISTPKRITPARLQHMCIARLDEQPAPSPAINLSKYLNGTLPLPPPLSLRILLRGFLFFRLDSLPPRVSSRCRSRVSSLGHWGIWRRTEGLRQSSREHA